MSFSNSFLSIFLFVFLSVNPLSFPLPSISDSPPFEQEDPQLIRIRGFWYPLTSEKGILAPYPDLKSCCLSAPSKKRDQLIVKGKVHSFSTQKAITLEGLFKIDPLYNEEGELIQWYVLEEAKELSSSFFLTFFSILIAILIICWIKRKFLLKLVPTM